MISHMKILRILKLKSYTFSSDMFWELYFCPGKVLNNNLKIVVVQALDIKFINLHELWKNTRLIFGSLEAFDIL